jgi:hypothetical protein
MGDNKLTRWDLEPTQVMKGFMVIDATESPDGKWVKYDEAAALITSLREALEEIAALTVRQQLPITSQVHELARTALNPSRKETI